MIAVILIIIAYLLVGTATLAIVKWYDRHCDNAFDRITDDKDDDCLVVVFWPMIAILGALYVIFVWIPNNFARAVMTLVTALFYTIKAIVRKEDGEKERKDCEK